MDNKFINIHFDEKEIKQYLDYIYALEQYNGYSFSFVEALVNFYNVDKKLFMDTLNIINYINEQSNNLSREDWDYIYKNFKSSDVVKVCLTQNTSTPLDIVEDIVNNTGIIKNKITVPIAQPAEETLQIISALQRDLSEDLLTKISNIFNLEFYRVIHSHYFFHNVNSFKLSQSSNSMICKSLLTKIYDNTIDFYDLPFHEQRPILNFFTKNSNKDLLVNIIKEDIGNPFLPDEIRSAIINNKVFDLEHNKEDANLINAFFENGVDITNISNYSQSIIDNIAEPFFATFKLLDDSHGEEIKIAPQDIQKSLNQLRDFAEKGILPVDIEYDIAKRLSTKDLDKIKSSVKSVEGALKKLSLTIFTHTKNPAIMNEISKLTPAQQESVLTSNKNLTVDIANSHKDKILKKLYKAKKENCLNGMSYKFLLVLDNLCHTVPFKPEEYAFILTNKELRSLWFSVVQSDKTPVEVLAKVPSYVEKMKDNLIKSGDLSVGDGVSADNYFFTPIALLSKFNLYCQNNNFKLDISPFKDVFEYISNLTPFNLRYIDEKSEIEMEHDIKFENKYHYYSNGNDAADMTIINLIDKIKESKNEISNIVDMINNFITTSDLTKSELNITKNFILELNTIYETKLEYDKDVAENFVNPSYRSVQIKSNKEFSLNSNETFEPECYINFKSQLSSFINIATFTCKNNIEFDYISNTFRNYILSKISGTTATPNIPNAALDEEIFDL
jgi:hypothetical protein